MSFKVVFNFHPTVWVNGQLPLEVSLAATLTAPEETANYEDEWSANKGCWTPTFQATAHQDC